MYIVVYLKCILEGRQMSQNRSRGINRNKEFLGNFGISILIALVGIIIYLLSPYLARQNTSKQSILKPKVLKDMERGRAGEVDVVINTEVCMSFLKIITVYFTFIMKFFYDIDHTAFNILIMDGRFCKFCCKYSSPRSRNFDLYF